MNSLADRLHRPLPLCLLLGLLAFAAALTGLLAGALPVDMRDALAGLGWGRATHPAMAEAVRELRLPRVVLGLLCGAALAVSGATLQGLFRNPLADPGLIGVSAGAALAAVVVIALGATHTAAPWLLPVASFAGAAATTLLVTRLSQSEGVVRPAQMLLVGLAVNAVTGAGIGLAANLASGEALRTLTFWLYGSLGRAGWQEIAVAAAPMLFAILWLPHRARELNALLLGEAEAAHVGVNVERLKRELILLTLLAVGGAVALSGIIAFVGLIVPQALRLWTGPDHRSLMPASALLGAALLTAADTVARTVAPPLELPVGVLTALLGGPFFLFLLLRLRGRGEWL